MVLSKYFLIFIGKLCILHGVATMRLHTQEVQRPHITHICLCLEYQQGKWGRHPDHQALKFSVSHIDYTHLQHVCNWNQNLPLNFNQKLKGTNRRPTYRNLQGLWHSLLCYCWATSAIVALLFFWGISLPLLQTVEMVMVLLWLHSDQIMHCGKNAGPPFHMNGGSAFWLWRWGP